MELRCPRSLHAVVDLEYAHNLLCSMIDRRFHSYVVFGDVIVTSPLSRLLYSSTPTVLMLDGVVSRVHVPDISHACDLAYYALRTIGPSTVAGTRLLRVFHGSRSRLPDKV